MRSLARLRAPLRVSVLAAATWIAGCGREMNDSPGGASEVATGDTGAEPSGTSTASAQMATSSNTASSSGGSAPLPSAEPIPGASLEATSSSGATAASESTSGEPTSDGAPAATSSGMSQMNEEPANDGAGGSMEPSDASASTTETEDGTQTAPNWKAEFPAFTRHEIAQFSNGYYTAAFDVDSDGLRDIAALAAGGSEIVWFKNPTWDEFSITSDVSGVICMDPHDVDGDGDLDLAFASEFSMTATSDGGTVFWAEAPDDPTQEQEWALHPIGEIPTSHRVKWAKLDTDGTHELVVLPIFGRGSSSPEYEGPVEFAAFAAAGDPSGEWMSRLLDDSLLEVAHALSVVDWDGDGVDELLTASNAGVHLFRPALDTAPVALGTGLDGPRPDRGSSEVGLGSLGGERFFATVEPWHGTDLVIYTPQGSELEPWTRQVFGTEFGRGHALLTADLNADGYDEVIAGDQDGAGALLIYRYLPSSGAFERIELDVGTIAVVGMDVQDVNDDGALDVIAIGGSSNNLVWYENTAGEE